MFKSYVLQEESDHWRVEVFDELGGECEEFHYVPHEVFELLLKVYKLPVPEAIKGHIKNKENMKQRDEISSSSSKSIKGR